jgi:dTMP kinase
LEGGEGAGKSTQARRLVERLEALGLEAAPTREPGGSAGAEALRSLLVDGPVERWSPMSETLILYAARQDHLERQIRPALERGAWVVSDRFSDSTRAYQGAAGGVPQAFIEELERRIVGEDRPDLTLILDLPVEEGLARASVRAAGGTRFENKGLVFHHRLRDAFLMIAAEEPSRCVVVDASRTEAEVETDIWGAVSTRLLKADPHD